MADEEVKTYVISFNGTQEEFQDLIERVHSEFGIGLEYVGRIEESIASYWSYDDFAGWENGAVKSVKENKSADDGKQ